MFRTEVTEFLWLKYLALKAVIFCSPCHVAQGTCCWGVILTCIITTNMHLNRVVRQWRGNHYGLRDIEVGACELFVPSVQSVQ